MGWLGNLFGKKDEKSGAPSAAGAPGAAGSTSSAISKLGGEKKTCTDCGRAMLPGTPCPFCRPQHFGEELPEGTISASYKPQQGVTGMGGVIVANQLAQQHGAKGFLHVYQGANKGASVLLASKVVTLGRKAEENILALNDAGVSSRHCEIRPAQSGWLLVDAGSKNGTFVNDKRVKEQALVNGDLIAFGGTRIYVGIL